MYLGESIKSAFTMFDFYQLYSEYSDEALVRILYLDSDHYQTIALKAVERILLERQLSTEQIEIIRKKLSSPSIAEEQKNNNLDDGTSDIFSTLSEEDMISPRTKRIYRTGLILLLVFYAGIFYRSVSHCFHTLIRYGSDLLISNSPYLLVSIYLPITSILLLKKRKEGWVMAFISMAVFVYFHTAILYSYLQNGQLHLLGNAYLLSSPIRLIPLFILARQDVCQYLGVNANTRKVGFIGALIVVLCTFSLRFL